MGRPLRPRHLKEIRTCSLTPHTSAAQGATLLTRWSGGGALDPSQSFHPSHWNSGEGVSCPVRMQLTPCSLLLGAYIVTPPQKAPRALSMAPFHSPAATGP